MSDDLHVRVPDGCGGYVERHVEAPPEVMDFVKCGQTDHVSVSAPVARRFWRQLWCDHRWKPVGFADWVCEKCGAER